MIPGRPHTLHREKVTDGTHKTKYYEDTRQVDSGNRRAENNRQNGGPTTTTSYLVYIYHSNILEARCVLRRGLAVSVAIIKPDRVWRDTGNGASDEKAGRCCSWRWKHQCPTPTLHHVRWRRSPPAGIHYTLYTIQIVPALWLETEILVGCTLDLFRIWEQKRVSYTTQQLSDLWFALNFQAKPLCEALLPDGRAGKCIAS